MWRNALGATAAQSIWHLTVTCYRRRGVSKINLMGWPWGTAIMGMYTTQNNDKVNRLVLYAPLWIFTTKPIIGGNGPLGAHRTVSRDSAKQLRAPNGVLQDLRTYWTADKAQYDPGEIRAPTLLIHAEWDADLPSAHAHGYLAKLTNTPYKRFIELDEGTHTIIIEKNRKQFFREVMHFINETDPLALN